MLNAELVLARKYKGELRLVAVDDARRERARRLAERYLATMRGLVGATREDIGYACAAIPVPANDRRMALGLLKLAQDECAFEGGGAEDAAALRKEVFEHASRARRVLLVGESFDRDRVLAEVAALRGTTTEAVERALYADLRGAEVLVSASALSPEALVERWELAQGQAVLLRAVKVSVDIVCKEPHQYRALFRQLKFHRLLYRIERREEGYRLLLDGPFSLFDSVTKYGLKLALLLGDLRACDRFELEADVRWGKAREPLVFKLEGGASARAQLPLEERLPEEVATLLTALRDNARGFRVTVAQTVLDLPGVGLCIPDLEFRRDGSEPVYLEVLGYWSRDAVFRRIELVQSGLSARVVFAASARLRVSEELLDEASLGALYTYKGTLSPRAVLDRVEALSVRSTTNAPMNAPDPRTARSGKTPRRTAR